jgi:hypothetical protein
MLDSTDATLPASGARDQWAFRITEAWQKTVNGFIEIGRAVILILYPSVVAHRQPLEISRGYPFVALLNYALGS